MMVMSDDVGGGAGVKVLNDDFCDGVFVCFLCCN